MQTQNDRTRPAAAPWDTADADLRHKLGVLARVGARLNAEGLTWAVGASAMLCLRGLGPTPHDLDIMVAEDDAEAARKVLASAGREKPYADDARYGTRHFHEFVIDGVEADLIGGYVIVRDRTQYECPLLRREIDASVTLSPDGAPLPDGAAGGTRIPLHARAAWHRYYTLMGRRDKAAACLPECPPAGDVIPFAGQAGGH